MDGAVITQLQTRRGLQGWRICPHPFTRSLFVAENYTFVGRGNKKGWRILRDQQDHYRAFATPEQAYAALTAVQQKWDQERDQIEKAFEEK
ncbi:MAG TPA: hypothetical protein VKR06_20260 [Ktedonosporobacter sp.]|nr:hypothetical protein [Ktedonosporobacter sp.]